MADIPNRDELERKIARQLGKLQRGWLGRLLELLGDPPTLVGIPETFWDEIGQELERVLAPFLESIFLDQALELMSGQPVGVDWALINRAAIEWARTYTFELVRGVTAVTQQALQRAVAAYFERGQTIGDLERALSSLFSPVRAEMIAITEITRAASQGELALADELNKMGITMITTWSTNRDELVCPLCAPLNGKARGDGWNDPPPRHPRCRCWLNHKLPKVKR